MDFLRYYVRFENPEMGDKFDKEIGVITQNNASMGIQEFILDRAKQEGKEQLMKEQIRGLLAKKQFSPEQIAEILGAPLALVLTIKKDLEGA